MSVRLAERRRPFFCANWKMNLFVPESVELAQSMCRLLHQRQSSLSVDIALAPSFLALTQVASVLFDSGIQLAAQNCSWEKKGAKTGEVSAWDLYQLGCRYVIIGHSERRWLLLESDNMVRQKVQAALEAGLSVILCVGEVDRHDARGHIPSIVKSAIERQLSEALSSCNPTLLVNMVIAYEPVWAIGTGLVATPDWAQSVHSFIRDFVKKQFGSVAEQMRIVYGGSLTSEHVGNFLVKPDVDGALVGGASLTASSFLDIVCYPEGPGR